MGEAGGWEEILQPTGLDCRWVVLFMEEESCDFFCVFM